MHEAWDDKNAYENLDRKPEGKRKLGRYRHKWEHNTKPNLTELQCV
jgi:hypothetical protein